MVLELHFEEFGHLPHLNGCLLSSPWIFHIPTLPPSSTGGSKTLSPFWRCAMPEGTSRDSQQGLLETALMTLGKFIHMNGVNDKV